jgi:hypothetical protein
VRVGDLIEFTDVIKMPPATGTVVHAEWDFEGAGDFPREFGDTDSASSKLRIVSSYAFSRPRTYFPTRRATSQRQGDAKTPFWGVQNLGRVRVVVT